MSALSPLSGVKRKLDLGAVRSAYDPKATLRACGCFYVTRLTSGGCQVPSPTGRIEGGSTFGQ